MAQSAVSNTIYEVTEAIIISVAARGRPAKVGGLSADTVAAKDEAKAAFALLGNIPGVLACVNGTLVAIRKPQGLGIGDTASILSRKGYYTLNIMVFESTAALCASPEQHKARILVTQLRSPAAEFLEHLPASDCTDYVSLVAALDSRCGDSHLRHLELQHVQQGKYSLQELAAHVERLSWKALACCPNSTADFIATQTFKTPSVTSTFNASSASPAHLLSVLP
ncbi:hypothetical protein HPB50_000157 [Hyalomma asiaticum]|uniref:Uncharacterized protein n=1 Tax=Hyalomma asiaticum TaxID=266040 RepID=A0ACB7TA78_HYAAI|nr:hypothetical protein HPB50_000157 [Hyalomma asiaticum]